MNASMLAVTLPGTGSVLFVLAVALGFFWVSQFVQLMLLEDGLFPGRFDKLLWAAAFVFVVPFAPFAFRAWKAARLAERSANRSAT